ncbi:MAG TPA: hypothetical protein VFQ44_08435 [Streptosporangiaceae bacterium]|nr:hypothetical protein [Streptosporangiaceae bacterium]
MHLARTVTSLARDRWQLSAIMNVRAAAGSLLPNPAMTVLPAIEVIGDAGSDAPSATPDQA